MDLETILLKFPGLFKKERALISCFTLQLAFSIFAKIDSIFSFNHLIKDSGVCRSLKRIFIVAYAYSGITLWAGLPHQK